MRLENKLKIFCIIIVNKILGDLEMHKVTGSESKFFVFDKYHNKNLELKKGNTNRIF
jgi:hypothetical protein